MLEAILQAYFLAPKNILWSIITICATLVMKKKILTCATIKIYAKDFVLEKDIIQNMAGIASSAPKTNLNLIRENVLNAAENLPTAFANNFQATAWSD